MFQNFVPFWEPFVELCSICNWRCPSVGWVVARLLLVLLWVWASQFVRPAALRWMEEKRRRQRRRRQLSNEGMPHCVPKNTGRLNSVGMELDFRPYWKICFKPYQGQSWWEEAFLIRVKMPIVLPLRESQALDLTEAGVNALLFYLSIYQFIFIYRITPSLQCGDLMLACWWIIGYKIVLYFY